MTMPKTACQNSIRIKFGDCSKNAILGSRTHISFFFSFLQDFSSPHLKQHFPRSDFDETSQTCSPHHSSGSFSRFLDFQNIFQKLWSFLFIFFTIRFNTVKKKSYPILKSIRLGKRSPLITPSCLKRDQIKNNGAPLCVKPSDRESGCHPSLLAKRR